MPEQTTVISNTDSATSVFILEGWVDVPSWTITHTYGCWVDHGKHLYWGNSATPPWISSANPLFSELSAQLDDHCHLAEANCVNFDFLPLLCPYLTLSGSASAAFIFTLILQPFCSAVFWISSLFRLSHFIFGYSTTFSHFFLSSWLSPRFPSIQFPTGINHIVLSALDTIQ